MEDIAKEEFQLQINDSVNPILSKNAWLLVSTLYSEYNGSTLARLDKVVSYVDESLFTIEPLVVNLFSTDYKKEYDILMYAKTVLIPKLYQNAINLIQKQKELDTREPDPLKIKQWD